MGRQEKWKEGRLDGSRGQNEKDMEDDKKKRGGKGNRIKGKKRKRGEKGERGILCVLSNRRHESKS